MRRVLHRCYAMVTVLGLLFDPTTVSAFIVPVAPSAAALSQARSELFEQEGITAYLGWVRRSILEDFDWKVRRLVPLIGDFWGLRLSYPAKSDFAGGMEAWYPENPARRSDKFWWVHRAENNNEDVPTPPSKTVRGRRKIEFPDEKELIRLLEGHSTLKSVNEALWPGQNRAQLLSRWIKSHPNLQKAWNAIKERLAPGDVEAPKIQKVMTEGPLLEDAVMVMTPTGGVFVIISPWPAKIFPLQIALLLCETPGFSTELPRFIRLGAHEGRLAVRARPLLAVIFLAPRKNIESPTVHPLDIDAFDSRESGLIFDDLQWYLPVQWISEHDKVKGTQFFQIDMPLGSRMGESGAVAKLARMLAVHFSEKSNLTQEDALRRAA